MPLLGGGAPPARDVGRRLVLVYSQLTVCVCRKGGLYEGRCAEEKGQGF